jgi:hypothetical protein
MDIDQNDILSTNNFIDTPNLTPNVSKDNVEEFKRFYEKDLQQEENNRLQARVKKVSFNQINQINYNENNDENNTFGKPDDISANNQPHSKDIIRDIKHLETLVSIDSRDRIKSSDPKANNFTIFLGKTFRNVKKIELARMEFPNTNAVINSSNNMIFWRNKEDIDQDITITVKGVTQYPVYSALLTIGSYTVSSLQSEILAVVNTVTRQQGIENGGASSVTTSKYHFFVITLNINSDLVNFYSLIMINLGNNALSTTIGSGTITVTSSKGKHGYLVGQLIYINGATQTAGIDGSILNGFHYVDVVTSDFIFTYTVNIQATVSTTGGGNTLQSGSFAPFQFLWGTQSNIIAQNIGYPLENSSQLITTNIGPSVVGGTSGQNINQIVLNTVQPTGFTQSYTYIGKIISIGTMVLGSFVSSFIFQITDITSTSIIVDDSNSVYESLISSSNRNKIQFIDSINNITYLFDTSSISQYNIPSFLINTQTPHNYTFNDIGNNIIISDSEQTPGGPNNDGTYTIAQLPSPTSIILPGTLTNPSNFDVIGKMNDGSNKTVAGTIPRQNPLSTWTVTIKKIDINIITISGLKYSLVTTTVPHLLQQGDSVFFNNLVSVPNLSTKSYVISSAPTSTQFYIQIEFGSVDNSNIIAGLTFIGTSLITVSYPSHGFNNILSISNDILYPVVSIPITLTTNAIGITVTNQDLSTTNFTDITPITNSLYPSLLNTTQAIRIQTLNPHKLSVNSKVRLTFTGTQPTMQNASTLNGGGYTVIQVISSDIFVIINKTQPFFPLVSIPSTINCILGLSSKFYLYGATSIGGIDQSLINSIEFTVRDIGNPNIIDSGTLRNSDPLNTFTFMCNTFATSTTTGGGSSVYISSLLHGFNGTQSNTKNNTLNRSINLEGENYSFLTCSVLNTMLNTGKVTNVFARISLDQPPGYVCFNFLSNPKVFDIVPLDILEQLTFSVYNYDNTLYEFNDLDWSFVLKITESVDYTHQFNISSRRGITDTTSVNK